MEKQITDFRIIALDVTKDINIKKKDRPFIDSILAVYLYDKNDTFVYCSTERLYNLHFLYSDVVVSEKISEDFDKADELYCKYSDLDCDESIDMTCKEIDKLEEELTKEEFRYHIEGEEEVPEDMTYEEFLYDVIEHCSTDRRI